MHISTYHQKIDNVYLPDEPKSPVPRSFQFSKVKSGIFNQNPKGSLQTSSGWLTAPFAISMNLQ